MTQFSAEEFINGFLQHAKSPAEIAAYNRAYYLKNRKLKGAVNGSHSNSKPPKRVEEDEVPMTSTSGAKLVDYDGKGSGKATYSDGSVFDGNGWQKPNSRGAAKANVNAAQRKNNAQRRLAQARVLANKVKDPARRRSLLARLNSTERRMRALK